MGSLPNSVRTAAASLLTAAALTALPSGGYAQSGLPDDKTAGAEARAEELAPAEKRYGLVEANGDILRIDREAGSVSFCRKMNGSWRCMPAPLAEEAYLDEISELSKEVDRLKARIRELEEKAETAGRAKGGAPQAEAENAEPPGRGEEKAPSTDQDKPSSRLSDEDEQQLERMMQFSEKAMRRFFGMMKDLQAELGDK